MKISYNGLNDLVTTFYAEDDVKKGDLVMISGNHTVELATSSDIFTGVCLDVREGLATVKLTGYEKREYSGTLTVGPTFLTADATGKVKTASLGMGRSCTVIAVDEATSTAEFIIY